MVKGIYLVFVNDRFSVLDGVVAEVIVWWLFYVRDGSDVGEIRRLRYGGRFVVVGWLFLAGEDKENCDINSNEYFFLVEIVDKI